MRRIDERTVELTPVEIKARDFFELLLDDGLNIKQARAQTFRMCRDVRANYDFWAYLGE